MDNFIEFLFSAICVVSLVFSIFSTKPGFLKYVDRKCASLGVEKYSGYLIAIMILLGWCVLYTSALNCLLWPYEPKWAVSIPLGVFMMLITMNWLGKYKSEKNTL